MSKKFDIDIFEVMKQAHKKNYEYFSSLSDAEKNAFQPWVAMRFMSASNDGMDAIQSILMTHYILNKNFTTISKDKELFYRLMCVTGDGKTKRHYMPKPPSGRRLSPLITDLVNEINGEVLDDDEVYLFLTKNDIELYELKEMAEDLQWDAPKIKELKKSHDNFMKHFAN